MYMPPWRSRINVCMSDKYIYFYSLVIMFFPLKNRIAKGIGNLFWIILTIHDNKLYNLLF
jgi:hypothetical protein